MYIALEISYVPGVPGYVTCKLFEYDEEISEGDTVYCFEDRLYCKDRLKLDKKELEAYDVEHKERGTSLRHKKELGNIHSLRVDNIMTQITFDHLYEQYKKGKLPKEYKQLTSLLATCKIPPKIPK